MSKFFIVFPFINPEWFSNFEWMEFGTRNVLGGLSVILDLIMALVLIFASCFFAFEHGMWYVPVGVAAFYILYGLFCLARNVYRQYRRAHPIPDTVLEKKRSIFRFSP